MGVPVRSIHRPPPPSPSYNSSPAHPWPSTKQASNPPLQIHHPATSRGHPFSFADDLGETNPVRRGGGKNIPRLAGEDAGNDQIAAGRDRTRDHRPCLDQHGG